MKKKWMAVLYGLALGGYGVFALLDAFVIPKNVVSLDSIAQSQAIVETVKDSDSLSLNETDQDLSQNEDQTSQSDSSTPVVSDHYYEDENLRVEISELREYDTTIYVADVQISDPSRLQTALAGNAFGQNLKAATSDIAQDAGAILAINGDYYGFRNAGYVMRNGYLYRENSNNAQDLVIDSHGNFTIVDESEVSASELARSGAVQIFSFGPGLIQDGEVIVNENSEVSQSMRSNPRTAIAQVGEGHYLFVVSDGRTSESAGLSLYELAGILQDLGAVQAYNLDGGGSSTMWFMGEVVNNPTSGNRSGERSVSDIVYVY